MALEAATHIADLVNTNPPGGDFASTLDEHLRLIKNVLKTDIPFTGAVTATHLELNKLAGYTGAVPELGTVQGWTKQQYFGEATLTDAVNIVWVLDDAQTAKVTLQGNRTLDNPTTMQAGGTYLLRIIQDATGGRTLAYGTAYKFPNGLAPTLTTPANAVDLLSCVSDGTSMFCIATLDLK